MVWCCCTELFNMASAHTQLLRTGNSNHQSCYWAAFYGLWAHLLLSCSCAQGCMDRTNGGRHMPKKMCQGRKEEDFLQANGSSGFSAHFSGSKFSIFTNPQRFTPWVWWDTFHFSYLRKKVLIKHHLRWLCMFWDLCYNLLLKKAPLNRQSTENLNSAEFLEKLMWMLSSEGHNKFSFLGYFVNFFPVRP